MNYEQLQNSNFSVEHITSDYWYLLRQVNIFTVDTQEYCPRFFKVNYAKNFKDPVVSFYALCSQILYIVYCRLAD